MAGEDLDITLNIRYDIPEREWKLVAEIYSGMDGWLGHDDLPRWYGTEDDERFIYASVEPGGVRFEGKMDPDSWTAWLTVLCARLSIALGREIHDAEM
ncbi:hypothetical protein EWM63_18145 [Pseudoduganella lutea]|uniref:Uncharacterized protein n=1 Tax=Pseudoduganella lutea TaxID=321985 RepID=A0A4P6L8P2_9BURK|nr:hypothetical protein EWM63_18145 [Pseudoduganella lutea]